MQDLTISEGIAVAFIIGALYTAICWTLVEFFIGPLLFDDDDE